jgi:hypothetical protein
MRQARGAGLVRGEEVRAMTNPHRRQSVGHMPPPLVPSLSHQLRWRDGGWARVPTAPLPPLVVYVAPEDGAATAVPAVGITPASALERQRSATPRAHLAALLRGLARRLEHAGERAARPSASAPDGAW